MARTPGAGERTQASVPCNSLQTHAPTRIRVWRGPMFDFKNASKKELRKEYRRIAQTTGDDRFFTKKELYHLPKMLMDEEQLLAFSSGLMDGNTWLIALTDRRVVFLDKGLLFGTRQTTVSIRWTIGGRPSRMQKTLSMASCWSPIMAAVCTGLSPAVWGISAAFTPCWIINSVMPRSSVYSRSMRPVSIAHSRLSRSVNSETLSDSSRPLSRYPGDERNPMRPTGPCPGGPVSRPKTAARRPS